MRSATSYFNGTLYRKTMARFWPLWAGYGLIWLFAIPLNMLNEYFNRYMDTAPQWRLLGAAVTLPQAVTFGLYLAAFFAILCAMAVFGYLYSHRSACWFHALPMRREALFTTQYLAGLSFLLLPQLAVAVLTAIIEMSFLPMNQWGAALGALGAFLLVQSGVCLFFFSFAAFCAMFTGHILALPAFYCILNALAAVIYYLVDALMREFFFGYAGSSGAARIVEYLTPFEALKGAVMWWEEDGFYSPATIAAYAGVGIALALVSLYVYRRRHVETAGDVVAVALVRPLFKYGVAFCSGLCLGMFTSAFFGWNSMSALIPCVLAWTVIGCFVAEMLLKKSFRVFKYWRGAAAMTAVMLVLCLGCTADLFGVEGRVPNADKVERLTVSLNMGAPYDGGAELTVSLTDPESIRKFIALHQTIADNRARLDSDSRSYENGDDYTHVRLDYTLKGGSVLSRRYNSLPVQTAELDTPGTLTYAMAQLLADRELVARAYDFDGFLENARLTSAYLDRVSLNQQPGSENLYLDDYRQELWDAVQKDFAEGNIGVRWLFENSKERYENTYQTDLIFEVTRNRSEVQGPASDDEVYYETKPSETAPSNRYLTVTLTPQAKHTLAVLEQAGIFEEGYDLVPFDSEDDLKYPLTASNSGWEIVY